MNRRASLLAPLALAAAMPGCAHYYYYGERGGPAVRSDVLQTNYEAADRLLQTAPLDPRRSVIVATLVSVDHLGESSRLGRMFSEQIASRIVQRGVPVAEVRLREQLALQPGQGELLLSRELREVSQNHDAQAVVVGTYAASPRQVFISLKLVRPEGNLVVAAQDYAVPMTAELRGLLTGR